MFNLDDDFSFADYDRDSLMDDLNDSQNIYAVDKAMDDYDDRKAVEHERKIDELEDEPMYEDDKHMEFYDNKKQNSYLGKLIGSDNSADQIASAISLGETFAETVQTTLEEAKYEPISGRDQKILMNRDFSKIKKNLKPFESYVTSVINGEEQQYLTAVKNAIDTLYGDLFGCNTRDLYRYLIDRGNISNYPSFLQFKHLHTLKTIADIAIETNEYSLAILIKYLIENKKINLEEGLVK